MAIHLVLLVLTFHSNISELSYILPIISDFLTIAFRFLSPPKFYEHNVEIIYRIRVYLMPLLM